MWITSVSRLMLSLYNFKYTSSQAVLRTDSTELRIGEVATATGVATSTLRYWESKGLLTAQRMRGQRRYGPEALERVALIEIAKATGFTLAEIRVLLAGLSDQAPPPEVWGQLARRKLPEIERKLDETRAMKRMLQAGLRCQCVTLQDCLGWASPDGSR
jgi:MerR family transcriptional regulator, redox-sensitive transcriptional activator SoxR